MSNCGQDTSHSANILIQRQDEISDQFSRRSRSVSLRSAFGFSEPACWTRRAALRRAAARPRAVLPGERARPSKPVIYYSKDRGARAARRTRRHGSEPTAAGGAAPSGHPRRRRLLLRGYAALEPWLELRAARRSSGRRLQRYARK
eukprot:SAG31_NODE_10_length_40133_cov_27.863041_25_plen_146_part_00